MIRVLALLPYPTGRVPGQRYRIEQWAPLLRREGIEVVFSPFLSSQAMDVLYEPGHLWLKLVETLKGYGRRLDEALHRDAFDALFVFREAALLGRAWFESLLSKRLPLIFDFDDAIYLPDVSSANRWAGLLKSSNKVARICALARHVIVGNETLAAYAAARSARVTVVPSSIDTDAYRVVPRASNTRPVVGWTGSATTLRHLKSLEQALASLRRVLDYEMRVIGGHIELAGVDVRCQPWRAETEAEDLRPLDVGLMPLPDDEWSRGKCAMKALQYMGLGIPPVVSPVGANATIVRDGVNGFHARTTQEWVERIVLLLRDGDLRTRMGREARRTVEEGFSARVQAPRLAAILREVAVS